VVQTGGFERFGWNGEGLAWEGEDGTLWSEWISGSGSGRLDLLAKGLPAVGEELVQAFLGMQDAFGSA